MNPLRFFPIICLLAEFPCCLAQLPSELLAKNISAAEHRNYFGSSELWISDSSGDSLHLVREGRSIQLLRKDHEGKTTRTQVASCFPDSTSRFSFVNDGSPRLVLAPGGKLYATWSDNKGGRGNKDVYLTWSDDNGKTWPEPVLVTYRPNHHDQFMPALAIDPVGNSVYLLYYDRQNSEDGRSTDLYLAHSRNGGLLFDYLKINPEPIPLTVSSRPGGTALSVENGSVTAFWLRPEGKKQELYRSHVNVASLESHNDPGPPLRIEKTFVWSDTLMISFEMLRRTRLSAVLTNPSDATFRPVTLLHRKKMKEGPQQLRLDPGRLKLKKGTYALTFYCENLNTFVWIVDN